MSRNPPSAEPHDLRVSSTPGVALRSHSRRLRHYLAADPARMVRSAEAPEQRARRSLGHRRRVPPDCSPTDRRRAWGGDDGLFAAHACIPHASRLEVGGAPRPRSDATMHSMLAPVSPWRSCIFTSSSFKWVTAGSASLSTGALSASNSMIKANTQLRRPLQVQPLEEGKQLLYLGGSA